MPQRQSSAGQTTCEKSGGTKIASGREKRIGDVFSWMDWQPGFPADDWMGAMACRAGTKVPWRGAKGARAPTDDAAGGNGE